MEGKSRDQVIKLVAKLQAMTVDRGATPAEAERAAAHAQRLLEQHQLTLLDVEAATIDEGMAAEELELDGQVRHTWIYDLGAAVSYPLDCDYVVHRKWDLGDLGAIKKPAVEAFFHERFPKCRETTLPRNTDDEARLDGQRAGETVELKRAIEDQDEPQTLTHRS